MIGWAEEFRILSMSDSMLRGKYGCTYMCTSVRASSRIFVIFTSFFVFILTKSYFYYVFYLTMIVHFFFLCVCVEEEEEIVMLSQVIAHSCNIGTVLSLILFSITSHSLFY